MSSAQITTIPCGMHQPILAHVARLTCEPGANIYTMATF